LALTDSRTFVGKSRQHLRIEWVILILCWEECLMIVCLH